VDRQSSWGKEGRLSDESFDTAKRILTLPELMRRLGDYAPSPAETGKGAFLIKSPLREDRNPSFSVYRKDGEWRWSDKATGEGGDAVEYLQARDGLDFKKAKEKFLGLAGLVSSPEPARRVRVSSKAPAPENKVPSARVTVKKKIFDWADCTKALTPEHIASITEWRGYPTEFVEWCRDQGWLGWYKGGPALPVHDPEGKVVGIHHRQIDDPSSWRNTAGFASPLIYGDPAAAPMTIVLESQWDALAAMASMKAHEKPVLKNMAFVASRGADHAAKLETILQGAKGRIAVVEQNDPPRPDGKPTGNTIWKEKVAKLKAGMCFTAPPAEQKDLNDWLKAGMDGGDFLDVVMKAQPIRTTKLSMRGVSELLGMKFDDSDCYLGDRVLAAGQPTSFLGPGGIGKSRMVLQLAVCCILGAEFLGLATRARGKKWLILQTENSNRRIRSDLDKLVKGFELDDHAIRLLDKSLVFHTIETDEDALLDLSEPSAFENVEAAVFDTNPDFVVLDPLNTFTSGDLNSDRDCRAVLMMISRAVKKGNPNRIPFIVHHSLTGKAGASKAVGWDKGSYGRNSKVLHAWVRSQWNLAPADPEDETKLILACGKNNNGRPFEEIGIVLDEKTGIYRVDEDFDAATYREAIGAEGKRKKAGLGRHYSADDIVENLDSNWIRVAALQRRVYDETGMSKTRFYVIWPEIKETLRVDRNERGEYRRGV